MRRPDPTPTGPRVSLLSLGCPKNLVDSERAVGAFVDRDFVICPRPEDAEVVVVNTCGFLEASKEEALDTIREMVALKKPGGVKGVVVMGCLTGRQGVEVPSLVPGVDAVVPFSEYDRLVSICRRVAGADGAGKTEGGDYRRDLLTRGERIPLTPRGSAYLKISDGCNNPCAFCTIPSIKGRHVSRPRAEILREARNLALGGVRELVVIGQDTTYWGFDLDREFGLASLVRDLARIPGIEWVRILYAYPAYVGDELLDTIRDEEGVLPYLDLPLQHVSDPVLRRMRRPFGGPRTIELLHRIRERVPGIVLRTTVIVGAPGEGEAEFEELLGFLEDFRFERLGCFRYSREIDTPMGRMDDQVPDEVKEVRWRKVMETQREIAFRDSRQQVGKTLECLIEEPPERGAARGRTERDAPEVDTTILVRNAPGPGALGKVRVTKADGYDLEGEWIG